MTRLLLVSIFFCCLSSLFGQRPEVVVTTGHHDQINAMAINPDATLLASGANDKLIKLWDMATGRELRTIGGNDGRIGYLEFDATGSLLGAGMDDGSLKIYNTKTGDTVRTFRADDNIADFSFCLNNTSVCYIDDENRLTVSSYKTRETPVVIEVVGPTRLKVHPNGEIAYVYDYQSFLRGYDLRTGAEVSSHQLFPEYQYAFTELEVSPDGKYLAIGFKEGSILIWDLENGSKHTMLPETGGPVTELVFDNHDNQLIAIDHNRDLRIWDLTKKKEVLKIQPTTFGSYCIVPHPVERSFLISDMNKISYLRTRTGKEVRTYEAVGNKIINLAYDNFGRYVAIASGDISIKLWDLAQNRITTVLPGFFPVEFSPNGRKLVSMGTGMTGITLTEWDPYSGEALQTLDTNSELIQNLSFSPDGNYLAGAGFMGIIKIWDMNTGEQIQQLTGHVGGIYNTCFSPDGKRLISGGMDQTIKVWDLAQGTMLQSIKEHEIIVSDVKYSPDGKFFASSSWDWSIKLWDAETFAHVRTFEGHHNMILSICFNDDGTKLASCAGNNTVAAADNTVRIWDVATGNEDCALTNHRDLVSKVIFQAGTSNVFSSGDDGMAKMWNTEKCEEIVSMISVNKKDFVLLTPDNYYTASKDALEGVSFRVGEELYPFDQFDLKLNRPDIVAARVGGSPPQLVEAYKRAYLKRLKKMNFTEEMLGDEFHLPNAKILTENLPVTTADATLVFKAEFWDKLNNLDRINVYVNDVPVFGVEGIDLRPSSTQRFEKEIEVPLIPGVNKVQVSCLNARGAESLRQTHEVIRETGEKVGNLHIIAIGVSNYKEERFRLDFAAKDARDFIKTFEQSKGLYNEVFVKEITDSLATTENIMALEEYLRNTKPEDVVIMFFAGHGMLSRDMEYFFGTYDIEFKNPLGKGLSYTKIEQLFNITTALKKLLIMDTCHSGEVDDEDLEVPEDDGDGQRNVSVKSFADAREATETGSGMGLENSYDLMQNLFSDIRKGTGATVISSAGGAEYAYESEDWNNGLFTFCLLNGLESKEADLNYDGEIYISELRAYVNQKVSELSDGLQNPTYRVENILLDYRIW